jgi:hypothetical protein
MVPLKFSLCVGQYACLLIKYQPFLGDWQGWHWRGHVRGIRNRALAQSRDCAIEAQATPSGPGRNSRVRMKNSARRSEGATRAATTGKTNTATNAITMIVPVKCEIKNLCRSYQSWLSVMACDRLITQCGRREPLLIGGVSIRPGAARRVAFEAAVPPADQVGALAL